MTIPIVEAATGALAGHGNIVTDPVDIEIEIVRRPTRGPRPVDPDSGDEGETTEGVFISEWKGDILYDRNTAVDGHYAREYETEPALADEHHSRASKTLLLWHANCHPDGGQLFFPQMQKPSVVPLAMPGDDGTPEDFVCFRFSGRDGLHIHPNVWHEEAFAISGEHRFFDKQGVVHACVSVDFVRGFNCLLELPLERMKPT